MSLVSVGVARKDHGLAEPVEGANSASKSDNWRPLPRINDMIDAFKADLESEPAVDMLSSSLLTGGRFAGSTPGMPGMIRLQAEQTAAGLAG